MAGNMLNARCLR